MPCGYHFSVFWSSYEDVWAQLYAEEGTRCVTFGEEAGFAWLRSDIMALTLTLGRAASRPAIAGEKVVCARV